MKPIWHETTTLPLIGDMLSLEPLHPQWMSLQRRHVVGVGLGFVVSYVDSSIMDEGALVKTTPIQD